MNIRNTSSTLTAAHQQPNSRHKNSGGHKWQTVRTELQRQHDLVINEIREYPFPIPACDAQYNYLLEQRAELFRAIKAIDRIAHDDIPGIKTFVKASPFICYTTIFRP